tara:strand:+ start:431 stop:877 length:447 start_codon:yes stop_codon:yes gene_type:complete
MKNYFNNKNKNNLETNIFVITNLYSLVSNVDQIKSINYLMDNKSRNILIYDHIESEYLPNQKLNNNLKKINNLRIFLINNSIKNNLIIFFILFSVMYKKSSFNLYLDSCNTLLQQLFLIFFKLKRYNIYGLCYTFPYAFQKINFNEKN